MVEASANVNNRGESEEQKKSLGQSELLIEDIEEKERQQRAQIASLLTQKSQQPLCDDDDDNDEDTQQSVAREMQQMADNEELREYITEMVLLISSGDEAADEAAIDMAAHNIHAKSVQVFEEYKASLKASLKEIKDEL